MFRALRRVVRRHRAFVRTLMLAFVAQVSGATHTAADVLACAEHEQHEDPDCSDGDEDCPPGCPDCHCSHAHSLIVLDPLGEPYQFATRVEFSQVDDGRASPSFSFGIYRPPRT
jgi:hypothetical protein